jgi:NADH:ubiquinone oxidoreductase subunit E
MDIKILQEILEKHKAEKGALVSILHDVQRHEGYLPEEALHHLSDTLHLPISELARVATYFEQAFSLEPRRNHTIKVCQGTTCYLKYGDQVVTEIKDEASKEGEDTLFNVEVVRCRGCCDSAPVVEIDGNILDRESATRTIIKLKGEKK